MKKFFNIIGALAIIGLILSSCGKDNKKPEPSPTPKPAPKTDPKDIPWNKNKTIEVTFISELKDANLSLDAINQIVKYDQANNPEILVVDRTDANTNKFSNTVCSSTMLGFEISTFYVYAFNKYKGDICEGSTILINHKINGEQSYKVTDDCWIKTLPIHTNTMVKQNIYINVPFGTVRFENKNQIEAAKTYFKKFGEYSTKEIIVGTVKKDALENLKTTVSEIPGFTVTTAFNNGDYAIVLLCPKNWVLRDKKEVNIEGSLNAYKLYVEADVE